MTTIVRDGIDQARDERRAQRVELGRERVRNDDRGLSVSGRERVRRLRLDESERDRLGEPCRRQDAAHQLIPPYAWIGGRCGCRDDRKCGIEFVESMMPSYFFNQIGLAN